MFELQWKLDLTCISISITNECRRKKLIRKMRYTESQWYEGIKKRCANNTTTTKIVAHANTFAYLLLLNVVCFWLLSSMLNEKVHPITVHNVIVISFIVYYTTRGQICARGCLIPIFRCAFFVEKMFISHSHTSADFNNFTVFLSHQEYKNVTSF